MYPIIFEMGVEEQFREIIRDEIQTRLSNIENSFKKKLNNELMKLKADLESMNNQIHEMFSLTEKFEQDVFSLIQNVEKEIENRMSLFTKLRRYTLDRLISYYRKLQSSEKEADQFKF